MAYEFMSLAEVEALEKVPDGATVFAEVGGAVKRIPGGGLGGGFVAVFTQDADSGEITCDKTFEECVAAFDKNSITGVLKTVNSGSYGVMMFGLEPAMKVACARFPNDDEVTFTSVGLVFTFNEGELTFNEDGSISM